MRGTPSMAAIANMNMAITLRPSMRSRCASIQARPAMRRMTRGGGGRAGDDEEQLEAEASGEISEAPRKTWLNRLAVSGVMAVQTIRLASVNATSSPISAASAGDDISPGADICSTSMK